MKTQFSDLVFSGLAVQPTREQQIVFAVNDDNGPAQSAARTQRMSQQKLLFLAGDSNGVWQESTELLLWYRIRAKGFDATTA